MWSPRGSSSASSRRSPDRSCSSTSVSAPAPTQRPRGRSRRGAADAALAHRQLRPDPGRLELACRPEHAATFGFAGTTLAACSALLERGTAEGEGTTWRASLGELPSTLLAEPTASADIVYWDPFSPRANPALWNVAAFTALRRVCRDGATVHTYSGATATRTAMLLAGFAVGSGSVLPSGRQATVAATRLEISQSRSTVAGSIASRDRPRRFLPTRRGRPRTHRAVTPVCPLKSPEARPIPSPFFQRSPLQDFRGGHHDSTVFCAASSGRSRRWASPFRSPRGWQNFRARRRATAATSSAWVAAVGAPRAGADLRRRVLDGPEHRRAGPLCRDLLRQSGRLGRGGRWPPRGTMDGGQTPDAARCPYERAAAGRSIRECDDRRRRRRRRDSRGDRCVGTTWTAIAPLTSATLRGAAVASNAGVMDPWSAMVASCSRSRGRGERACAELHCRSG